MNKKRLIMDGIVLLLSSIIGFLVLEMSYRYLLFGTDSFSIKKMNSIHEFGVSGLIKPSSCPEMIYELRPDLQTYYKLTQFATNSNGLRDKEYQITKPEKTFRVAVVGDSFTMGSGVKINDTFHTLLEETLNEKQQNLSYEFINFGTGGYSLRQYLGVVNCKVELYNNPNMILVGFFPGNDHHILSEKVFEQPYTVKKPTNPFFSSLFLRYFPDQFKQYLAQNRQAENADEKETPILTEPTNEQIAYMSEVFSDMGKYSRSNAIPIVIVYLTYRTDHPVRPEMIKEMVEPNGLYFVDISPAFKDMSPKELIISPIDGHPNEQANMIFATQIYTALHEMQLIKE